MLPCAPMKYTFRTEALRLIRIAAVSSALISTAMAQTAPPQSLPQRTDADVPAFAPKMIDHMQRMRQFKDADRGTQPPPPMILRLESDRDDSPSRVGV
jgi:hypothetical protein